MKLLCTLKDSLKTAGVRGIADTAQRNVFANEQEFSNLETESLLNFCQ
jgi:hypothetical protein